MHPLNLGAPCGLLNLGFVLNGPTTTFDLTPLQQSAPFFFSDPTNGWKYIFNPCSSLNGSTLSPSCPREALAYQLQTSGICVALGRYRGKASMGGAGVEMELIGGDLCGKSGPQRYVSIELVCGASTKAAEVAQECGPCCYNVRIFTPSGCAVHLPKGRQQASGLLLTSSVEYLQGLYVVGGGLVTLLVCSARKRLLSCQRPTNPVPICVSLFFTRPPHAHYREGIMAVSLAIFAFLLLSLRPLTNFVSLRVVDATPTKRRVAFCFRGGMAHAGRGDETKLVGLVGGTNTTPAYVNYRACAKSIFLHIVQANAGEFDFDFFQHSWNPDLEHDLRSASATLSLAFFFCNFYLML